MNKERIVKGIWRTSDGRRVLRERLRKRINEIPLRQILEENKIEDGQKWGRWEFIERNLTLVLRGNKENTNDHYEIDLERCRSGDEVLNWICQIHEKIWADNDVLADLVRALDRCLNLQRNVMQRMVITKTSKSKKVHNEGKKQGCIMEEKMKSSLKLDTRKAIAETLY